MSFLANLLQGIALVLQPSVLLLMVIGLLIGITMGSIPGMTATMTVAVLVSFTFGMQPIEGMTLLLGIYGGALYAGSIPAILIRTPGTPSAAATVFDGYPLAKQGKAGQAISIATIASVIGGIISVIFLTILSPQVAKIALEFGSPEYFALAFFGLTIIANVSGDSLVKGLLTGLLGMFLATVGLDPIAGVPRFTFGSVELTGGIEFIAVMIGLFGIAEGLNRYAEGIGREAFDRRVARVTPTVSDIRAITPTAVLSGIAGTFIGAIPGAGGDIASFVTYNEATRWLSEQTPSFGDGNPLGVAAAESGNNSSTGGALIPTLTLGIPGDSVTAILIGALMVHGIRPGPNLLEKEPQLVYAIFVAFFLIYVLILVFGLLGAHLWVILIDFPAKYLWPAIFVLCAVGAIALRGNLIDIWVMLGAGLLGLLLRADGYPLAPMVLGMILGPIAESNLRRSLTISGGSLDVFVHSPIAFGILALTAVSLLIPIVRANVDRSPFTTNRS
ncbi:MULTISPECIES: tripartite tricarboxylate transporter permease [unclassified Haladaptatus]|uniref:tripartite tricarboxylate transporter permease n=1 Tax=unclassified Haladaptatus TaxID=2622732 RepID=UPI00209BDE88|nr:MULTISPECIES: tripartite tricarboxylate transporter permease [unclassified Haladaptatus]MCO8244907.1 tripartite tricarboxylate transporter permease [Haladaptatus sp. AB643]MCO8255580.1 tripartite tricarboxylate transporter permease [Haladaptatus sp. AB618]